MSVLNIPGFTAEASLQKPSICYSNTKIVAPDFSTQVAPQLTLCDKARYFCDIGYNEKYWCSYEDKYCGG